MIIDLENLFNMGKKKITQGDNLLKIEWYLYEIGINIKTIFYIVITKKWAENSSKDKFIHRDHKFCELSLIAKDFIALNHFLVS